MFKYILLDGALVQVIAMKNLFSQRFAVIPRDKNLRSIVRWFRFLYAVVVCSRRRIWEPLFGRQTKWITDDGSWPQTDVLTKSDANGARSMFWMSKWIEALLLKCGSLFHLFSFFFFCSVEPIIKSYKLIFTVLYLAGVCVLEKFTILANDEYGDWRARKSPFAVRSLFVRWRQCSCKCSTGKKETTCRPNNKCIK